MQKQLMKASVELLCLLLLLAKQLLVPLVVSLLLVGVVLFATS